MSSALPRERAPRSGRVRDRWERMARNAALALPLVTTWPMPDPWDDPYAEHTREAAVAWASRVRAVRGPGHLDLEVLEDQATMSRTLRATYRPDKNGA